jgi:hypothetical protein
MNEQQKEWLQYALFLDQVNVRTLRHMLGDGKQVREAFSWFKCEGSVRDPKGDFFCVREYIRSRLKEYLYRCDPDRFTELQNKGHEAMNDANEAEVANKEAEKAKYEANKSEYETIKLKNETKQEEQKLKKRRQRRKI